MDPKVAYAHRDDVATLAGGRALRSCSCSTTVFAGLAAAVPQGHRQVVDARRDDERAQDDVRGSVHIPLHELSARANEVPVGGHRPQQRGGVARPVGSPRHPMARRARLPHACPIVHPTNTEGMT